jgi:hypothetical protein
MFASRTMPPELISSTIRVRGVGYERIVVRTHWIQPGEGMPAVVRRYLQPVCRPGDVAIVSEKATVIASDLGIPASEVRPGRLASWLARRVRPTPGSRGISIPEKMELVVRETGAWRVMLAACAAALTRPLHLKGAFYVIAGRVARGMDGMRPPLEDVLLPPLHPREAKRIAQDLAAELGTTVAIVDINDRGGCVRAVSGRRPTKRELMEILRDNPLGQRDQQTPLGIVRRAANGGGDAQRSNGARR